MLFLHHARMAGRINMEDSKINAWHQGRAFSAVRPEINLRWSPDAPVTLIQEIGRPEPSTDCPIGVSDDPCRGGHLCVEYRLGSVSGPPRRCLNGWKTRGAALLHLRLLRWLDGDDGWLQKSTRSCFRPVSVCSVRSMHQRTNYPVWDISPQVCLDISWISIKLRGFENHM